MITTLRRHGPGLLILPGALFLAALFVWPVARLVAIGSWHVTGRPALRSKGAPSDLMRRLRRKPEPARG